MNTRKAPKNAILLSKNQPVGDGFGMFHFRDLYRLHDGKMLSIPKTHPIDRDETKR
jgi:hypothetical protein